AAEAATQDFEHHAEVVLAGDGLDAVAPIAVLVRLALIEGHHGADRHAALEGRDVDALDAFRRIAQVQLAPQLVADGLVLPFAVLALAKALLGVLARHLEQPHAVAALRAHELHPAPLAL